MTSPNPIANPSLVQCPECNVPVKQKRLDKHRLLQHQIPLTKSATKDTTTPSFVRCPHCKNLCPTDSLAEHLRSHEQRPPPTVSSPPTKQRDQETAQDDEPIGITVLKALARGQRYIAHARSICRCQACSRQIVFLDVDGSAQKAFDVSASRVIEGTHACESGDRRSSIKTIGGGAVDSNRRRH